MDLLTLLLAKKLGGGGGGGDITVQPLNVTSNGTYTAPSNKAYSPVNVNVPTGITPSGTLSIVQNGQYDVSTYASADVNVSSGEVVEAEIKDVNFYDYDGTRVYSYTFSEANALAELPPNPSHEGLIAEGWNWELQNIKDYISEVTDGVVNIGQQYITDDGKTRLYLDIPYSYDFILGLGVNGTLTIDWGDGSPTEQMTGSNINTVAQLGHVYGKGSFVISIKVESGEFIFGGALNNGWLFRRYAAGGNNQNRVNMACLKKVEVGEHAGISSNSAFSHASIETISIPKGMREISTSYAFNDCPKLRFVSFPFTWLSGNAFGGGTGIERIVLKYNGSSETDVWGSVFNGCGYLQDCTIHKGSRSIKDSAFANCFSLMELTIPRGVASIGANAFTGCYNLLKYHFLPTTPPSLANTNAFTNIQSSTKIYVPYSADHSILEAYQTATNWSSFASYMEEEPQ